MLGHHQAYGGHLMDLPAGAPDHWRVRVQGRLAVRIDRQTVLDHGVGRRHQMQGRAAVAQLPARLLAAGLAQAPRPARRAPQPITRWRLAAVVAVLGLARFQLLHACHQLRYLLSQGGVVRLQAGILGLQFDDTGFSSHVSMLHCCASPPDLLLLYFVAFARLLLKCWM
jgi:hypothetical protein